MPGFISSDIVTFRVQFSRHVIDLFHPNRSLRLVCMTCAHAQTQRTVCVTFWGPMLWSVLRPVPHFTGDLQHYVVSFYFSVLTSHSPVVSNLFAVAQRWLRRLSKAKNYEPTYMYYQFTEREVHHIFVMCQSRSSLWGFYKLCTFYSVGRYGRIRNLFWTAVKKGWETLTLSVICLFLANLDGKGLKPVNFFFSSCTSN